MPEWFTFNRWGYRYTATGVYFGLVNELYALRVNIGHRLSLGPRRIRPIKLGNGPSEVI